MKFIAVITCFCFYVNTTIAQYQKSYILNSDRGYIWQNDHYKFSEMAHIFESDDSFSKTYATAIESSTIGNTVGWTSIVLLPTSIFLGINSIDFDLSSSKSNSAGFNASAFMFYTSILISPIAIIYKVKANKLRTSLIKDYNNQLIGIEPQKDNIDLSFGSTQNGLGFVLRF